MSCLEELIPVDQLTEVSVQRSTQASGSGGQPTETPVSVDESTLMGIEKLSGRQKELAFGSKSRSTWRGFAGSSESIEENDIVTLLSGSYEGQVLEVVEIRIPGGWVKILGLTETNRTS